jgi:hypothetical protein
MLCHYAENHYAECRYAKCHCAECHDDECRYTDYLHLEYGGALNLQVLAYPGQTNDVPHRKSTTCYEIGKYW